MRLVPIFPDGDQPGFNHEAALDAYEWALSNPEEASVVAKALALDEITELVEKNYEVIQGAVDEFYAQQIEVSKRALKRVVISKAQRGEDVDEYVAVGEDLIAKAEQIDFFTRQRNAQMQWRDPRGRWRTMNVKIAQNGAEGSKLGRNQELPPAVVQAMQIPRGPDNMAVPNKSKMQNAYLQVAEALGTVQGIPSTDVISTYKYRRETPEGQDDEFETRVQTGNNPTVDDGLFATGYDLDEIEISVDPTLSAGGAAFDLVAGLAGPERAGQVLNQGIATGAAASQFKTNWDKIAQGPDDEQETRRQDFQRIGNASQFVGNAFGNQIGPAGRFATSVGNFVGTHGPQAEEVLGPGTRKLSYRYRGVEKRPDPELQTSVDETMKQISQNIREKEGKTEVTDADKRRYRDAAREVLIYGPESKYGKQFGNKGKDGKPTGESPLIMRMAENLPDMALARLQLASGHVPPSHGVIIDRKGVITTQAVGYGDDWYLPFNLKNIGQVNGGEYVRTRTLGGPTSEDIYTALITEARGITVVSHSGVYNIEFDKTFRGGRRFNDKARRMVDRYEKLLDAVKEGNVSPSIPQDRLIEINQVIEETGLTGDPARQEFRRLEEQEAKTPEMSKWRIEQERDRFINEVVAQDLTTGDDTTTMDDLKEEYVNKRSTQILAEEKAAKPNAATADVDWDALSADAMSDRPESFQALNDQLGQQTGSSSEMNMTDLKASEAYRVAQQGVKAGDKRESAKIRAAREFEEDPIAALEFTHPGTTEKWDRQLGQLRYSYRQAHRGMQLDANGYRNALKALQEQFPYYIKRTEWRPLNNDITHSADKDKGYVLPAYNRPTAAKAGYYDVRVTGAGKVSAAETGYQNIAVRRKNQGVFSRTNQDDTQADQYAGPGAANGLPAGTTLAQRAQRAQRAVEDRNRRFELYDAITGGGTLHVVDYGNDPTPRAVNFRQADWKPVLLAVAGRYFPIHFGDLDGIDQSVPNYQGPRRRSDIPGSVAGATGPFTRTEFDWMLANVEGFGQAAFDEAQTLNTVLKSSRGGPPSIPQDRINAVERLGANAINFPRWPDARPDGSVDVPETALTDFSATFSFPGREYRGGQPARTYKEEARNQIIAASRRMAAAGISGLKIAEIDLSTDYMDDSLNGLIADDLRTTAGRIGQGGNQRDQAAVIEHLHRIRALLQLNTNAVMLNAQRNPQQGNGQNSQLVT